MISNTIHHIKQGKEIKILLLQILLISLAQLKADNTLSTN